MLYVNSNNTLLPNNGRTIHTGNRAYLYGDGVFESIRIINGEPINLENHIMRMLEGARKIKMRPPSYYTVEFFEKIINELIKESQLYSGGKCRISLDRSSGGTYRPESNEIEFFIEVYPLDNSQYVLNEKGIEIDIYTEFRKEKTPLSNFKTKNGLIYIMASISAQENGLGDYLLTDTKGGILEGTSSNLFIVSNGVLYTPGLDSGCLAGTMRMQIINLAIKYGIKVYECNILPQNLLVADELFLTNSIDGITWVRGYRTKRYFNNISKKLMNYLNQEWTNLPEKS